MKVFITTSILTFTVLFTIPGQNVQAVTKTTERATVRTVRAKKPVPLGLHTVMQIFLKNGSSVLANLTGFNLQKKTIQITPINGSSSEVQIAEIKRIIADKKSPVVDSDGKSRVIRGEDNAKAKQSTWSSVPLNQFQVQQGQTHVDLSNVVNPMQLRGIHAVAKNSLYVVDEIEFDASQNMTIKVKPIDKPIVR